MGRTRAHVMVLLHMLLDVMSSRTLALRAYGGAFFCKRLTSQTEMVASSVDVSIMDRAASVTLPFSYFETCDTFRASDHTAVGTDLSA